MKKGKWTFLTNHGRVLAYIAKHPRSTTEEIAREVGITLRAVQKIIAELEADGYINRNREGRRNSYSVHSGMPMRHPLEQEYSVGDILKGLGYSPGNEDSGRKD
jgi:DNA-binding Lrp family transcriptional regulator